MDLAIATLPVTKGRNPAVEIVVRALVYRHALCGGRKSSAYIIVVFFLIVK